MKGSSGQLSWTLEETINLLRTFVEHDCDWGERASVIQEKFSKMRPPGFFTEQECKKEFDRIMQNGHPEHIMRSNQEDYSQKELVRAWISHYEKEYDKKLARDEELLLVKARENAELFNRLMTDDQEVSEEEFERIMACIKEQAEELGIQFDEDALDATTQQLEEHRQLSRNDPENYSRLEIVIPATLPPERMSLSAPSSPIKPPFEGLTPPPKITLPVHDAYVEAVSSSLAAAEIRDEASDDQQVDKDADDALCVTEEMLASVCIESAASTSVQMQVDEKRENVESAADVELSLEKELPEEEITVVPEVTEQVEAEEEATQNKEDFDSSVSQNMSTDMSIAAKEPEVSFEEPSALKRGRASRRTRRSLRSSEGSSNPSESIDAESQPTNTPRTRRQSVASRRSSVSSANASTTAITVASGPDEEKIKEDNKVKGEIGRSLESQISPEEIKEEVSPKRRASPQRRRSARCRSLAEVAKEQVTHVDSKKRRTKTTREEAKNTTEAKKSEKRQLRSNVEVQSSPEPEIENVPVSAASEESKTKTLASADCAKNATKAAEKGKTVPTSEVPSKTDKESKNVSPKRTPLRRRLRKGGELDGDVEQRALMATTLRYMSSHRHASIFAHPVTERDARGYSKTVRCPMDLSTLKKRMEGGGFEEMNEFRRNVLLMFANAVMYNSTGHDVNTYAKEMASDTFKHLQMFDKNTVFARGGTHMTRRIVAAEEASKERQKFPSSSDTPAESVDSKEMSVDVPVGATFETPKQAKRRSKARK